MEYEVSEDRSQRGDWRVEAIDMESEGECYMAIFTGPLARERATEYAEWKNLDGGRQYSTSAAMSATHR